MNERGRGRRWREGEASAVGERWGCHTSDRQTNATNAALHQLPPNANHHPRARLRTNAAVAHLNESAHGSRQVCATEADAARASDAKAGRWWCFCALPLPHVRKALFSLTGDCGTVASSGSAFGRKVVPPLYAAPRTCMGLPPSSNGGLDQVVLQGGKFPSRQTPLPYVFPRTCATGCDVSSMAGPLKCRTQSIASSHRRFSRDQCPRPNRHLVDPPGCQCND